MKRFSKRVLARIIGVFSLTALLASTLIPTFSATAALTAGDYFQITAAGNATTATTGSSLQFTLVSKDASNVQNPITGDDSVLIEVMDPVSQMRSPGAAVTALGEGLVIKPSVDMSDGITAANISEGTPNRNYVAVSIADGAAVTNTFTISAVSTYKVFVWAPGSTSNEPGDDPLVGQSEWQVVMTNGSSGADHLKIDLPTNSAEVNESASFDVVQVNAGNGIDTAALTDVAIDVAAVNVLSGTQSGLIESSATHDLDVNSVVKFTSATSTSAYYVVSTDASNTTFKVIGASNNLIFSNSNIIKVTGMSAGAAVALDEPGSAITANTASIVNTQGVTTLVAGDIVSLAGGSCTGYYSVTAAVNNGADSTVTVVGPTACTTGSGNITKITLTDGTASAFTVSDGAGANGYIVSVGGVATGNQTTTLVTGKTLTSGISTLVVGCATAGTVTITPSSATLSGTDSTGSLVCSSATTLEIRGYGPTNSQTGVPTTAPVDFMFNKNPTGVFPMVNTASSTFKIVNTSTGVAVTGTWNSFQEPLLDVTGYRVSFSPSSPLVASTGYTFSVDKTLAGSTNLQGGMTALTNGETAYSSTFTTGTGGENYTPGGGYTGTQGGTFPPMAMLDYPKPGEWNVPTNISCITVGFDRAMDSTTLTTSNVYIKKMVNNTETAVSGTPAVTVGIEGKSVCISMDSTGVAGNILEASSEYRVVVTRDVKDPTGTQLAGMPIDDNGNPTNGFGFGFGNMGPFKQSFHTGSGSLTVTATLMGFNLDKYKSAGIITGVPVGSPIRASFNAPLDMSKVNTTNVTLKKNGTVTTAGTVYYDAGGNAIEFVPALVLAANTSYTFAVSANVTSISGQAISALSQTFATGAADSTSPTVVFAEADNYGIMIQFDETMTSGMVGNKSYYTLKTCGGQSVNADGVKCADNSTDPTSVILTSATAQYEKETNTARISGLTLTSGDGFYISASNSVTDVAGNGVNASYKSWTGFVMNSSNFQGGQGMFQQGTMGMEDFNMKNMGQMPVGAHPMNSMANMTTIYFLDIPLTVAIPADGYIELTFPAGTDVSGALQDQYSPMNSDFNGPSPGAPTFKAGVTSSVSTDTASTGAGTLDNGIGFIAAARKVYIQLSAATQATDFLHIDLAGIKNPSEPKDFNTTGYQAEIKTFNASGTLLESTTTMPYFINASGTNTISGQITAGGAGVNGIRVFLDSWAGGFQETTTSLNGAGDLVAGNNAGEYTFGNLPNGDYHVFIEPQNVGGTDYSEANFNIDDVSSATTKSITLTAQNGTNCAILPITVNIANIGNITNLGASDSIDVFGWNTTGTGGFVKTLTRQNVIDSVATPINVFLCNTGMYSIGVGPAIPKGNFSAFQKMEWMPPQNQNKNVLTTDIDESKTTFSAMTFAVSAPDATITGIVKDSAGTAVSGGKVFADFSAGGFGGDTDIGVDGTFSIPASKNKSYRVGAFIPGMPPAQNHFVSINASGTVYVDGSPVASTGSSGANPLVITMQFNSTSSLTVSGRVSDGTNAIAGAGIWAHRTDAMRPPVNGFTDSSGNYILYIPEAGTWQVEANAPGLGFLGSKTLTVTTEDFTGQDFEPLAAASMGTIAGDIEVPGTDEDSGVVVTAYNADGYFNMAVTESDGTYTMDVPIDTDAYTVKAWSSNIGELAKTTQVVDGIETVSPATLGTPQTFTITLEEAVSADTFVDFKSTMGMGTGVVIPAGETATTVTLPQGDYYLGLDMPFDETNVVVAGAEFNAPGGVPVTTDQINIDGTGDDITLTLPNLNTISGTIDDTGTGVENVLVTIVDSSTQDTFTVLTDSSGNYTAEVPDGTYSILAEQSGYVGVPEDVTVTANLPNQDITLDPADKTIQGTITNSSGSPVEGALVYATMAGGGMAMDETGSDGTYTMHVSNGTWNVEAVTDGYVESGTPLAVNASTANVTSANIQLPATAVALDDPATTTIDSGNANLFADADLDIEVTVPANSVDADSVLNFAETNELPTTSSSDPFSTGVTITGTTTNDSTTLNGFDNNVDLSFEYTVAGLATEGVDTPTEMGGVSIGYMNESTNNWTTMSTAITYFDSTGTVIPDSTVEGYSTLVAAAAGVDLTTILLSTATDHLTTFAPIVSSGATPPATPSGLVASAGDTQVTLTWTKNSEADMSYYNIWEANVTEGVATTLLQSACGTTTCSKTITSLTNGTAYAYQIAAVDTGTDTSAYCTAVNSTPVAATVTPSGGGTILNSGGSSKKTTTETDEDEEATDEEATDDEATDEATGEGEPGTSGANLGAGAGASGPTPFTDIVGHWAELYIDELYSKSVLEGASEEKFEPDSYVSRAEISKIVVNTFALETLDPVSIDANPFKDVSKDMWYATFVKAASDDGLMEGYNDGTFKPDRKITRAEALKVFLIGALGADGIEDKIATEYDAEFSDVGAGEWYAPYVNYATEKGIVNGYADGTFGPESYLTRAEVAKIASKILGSELSAEIIGMIMGIL